MPVDVRTQVVQVSSGRERFHAGALDDDRWVISVFREAMRDVPAYRRFLEDRSVDPWRIRTLADFRELPFTDAPGYLERFPLEDLLAGGSLSEAWILSTDASGPRFGHAVRGVPDHAHAAAVLGPIFEALGSRRWSTLSVVAFPMGSHFAGTYHLQLALGLRSREHQITTITPGTEIERSVDALREIAPHFEQTIIQGTPGLTREILMRAAGAGIDLPALRIGLMVSGEPIAEDWRDEIGHLIASEPADRVRSFYSSAEIGAIAVETRATVRLRRLAAADPRLRRALFGDDTSTCPELFEYNPQLRFVESADGALSFTVAGSRPLIRYQNGDTGWVIPPGELRARAQRVLGDRAPAFPSRPCILLQSS